MDKRMSELLQFNMDYLEEKLHTDKNFDILKHEISFGNKKAVYYFIDGFCKDDIMQKLNQFFVEWKDDNAEQTIEQLLQNAMPYPEIGKENRWDNIICSLLSGVIILFIEGLGECIYIDARTYPARDVSQPEKEKALRGARDGFVETIVFNTALLRRRIRDEHFIIEMKQVGTKSKTDVAVCYMEGTVDQRFLTMIMNKIAAISVEALTVSQETLAECLYPSKWYNPFPKFRFTERPDVASAQLIEGNIIILTDNSPFAMILPVSLFDILEEADDYYFPPITGTYLRLSRILIGIISFFITPTYLLLMMNPDWIPISLQFIQTKETVNVPIILQFLILELGIDGLRLAAVNTPNMLSTPLSVMAALVIGEFSVNSGWFNAEVMLYMAFVAIANYTQTSYEFGYAVKFLRIITLIATAVFGVFGYIMGIMLYLFAMLINKTISGRHYLYPLIPFHLGKLRTRLFRRQLH